jgi:hypothetical protein
MISMQIKGNIPDNGNAAYKQLSRGYWHKTIHDKRKTTILKPTCGVHEPLTKDLDIHKRVIILVRTGAI